MSGKKWVYVYLFAGYKEDSVQKKIRSQINALRNVDIDIKGVFFTHENGVFEPNGSDYSQIEFVAKGPQSIGFFRSLKDRSKAFFTLKKWLSENQSKFDRIYLRYDTGSFRLLQICLKYGKVMCLEYQSKTIQEIRHHYYENPFGLRPSLLLSWLEHQLIPIFREMTFGRFIVGKVNTIVGVTKEIAEYEFKRALFGRPECKVVGNGVEVSQIQMQKVSGYDPNNLKLLMLIGSSKGSTWNGVDRIVEGIRRYNGPVKIELHVAGNSSELDKISDSFVHKYGFLRGDDLMSVISICNIGIGAFGFDRIPLREGSTLKMREYGALGLPCVYGHFDDDYEGLVGMGLALRLADERTPNMDEVVSFSKKVLLSGNYAGRIRDYAMMKMDFSVKMEKLRGVLNGI